VPIYTIDQLRSTAPKEFRDLSDEDLVRQYSQYTGTPFEQAADFYGVKPRGTLSEMGRQAVGGAVVDLPKMVGQGLQYTGIAPQYGKEMAQAAEARAPQYAPDMRGRGLLGQAGVLGARGLAPVMATAPLAFIPGVGEAAAAGAAATLFGTSSAQETYDKLVDQGIDPQEAAAAARRVGMIQGPLEGLATFTGARAAKGLSPLLGIGGKTTAGVAGELTDTSVAKPFLKSMGINAVVQPGTEVAQDLGTYAVEQAYGAQKEDPYEIAKQSALGGFGLTMLLGPLSLGGHMRRAKQAEALNQMLYGEDTNPEQQMAARRLIVDEAQKQGVPPSEAAAWFERQYREDAAGMEMLKEHEDAVIENGKESPLADISYALTDPEFSQKISDPDREQLVQLVGAVQQGKLSQEQHDAAISQASNILGRYLVDEYDQHQEQDLMQPVTIQRKPALLGGLTQVETSAPQDLTAYNAPQGLGREIPRITPVEGAAGIGQIAPGIFQATPQLQQVETKPQAVTAAAPAPVISPGAPTAVAAVTPATPIVAGASLKGKKRGAKTTEAVQAETQGQAATTAAVVTPEAQAAEDKHLSKLLEDVDQVDVGQPLPAAVRGAETVKAPGRTSMGTEGLKKIRDALVNAKGTLDEKQQRIVNALNNFAEAYKVYSDQGGQVVSRRTRVPKSKTAEQYAGEQVAGTELHAANVQAALAELGQAVGGNAKDIEAIVRLVKDMVQGKVVAPGKTRSEVIQAAKKLDTMLSQAWAAAKRETFMGATPDLMDIRSGEIRNAKEQGEKVSPLEQAANEGVGGLNKKAPGEKVYGLPAVMSYLRNHGTPFERMLAAVLRDVFTAQMNDVKLVFIDNGDSRFDPATNTVYLQRNESPEVSLHEALHAALQSFIYKNPKDPMVMQLKKSLKAVVNYKGELTGKAKEVQDLLKKLVGEKNELDAVLELVSYGTTLADFRKALEAMPSKGVPASFRESVTNVWRYIKAVMARMLGKPNTVAADVLDTTLALLERASKVAPEKGQGQVLEAAVTTTKPLSDAKVAETLGVREQDYSRFNKSNAVQLQVTQRAFETVGWNQANMEKLTGKAGDKMREFISKNFPGTEIVLGWINSRYNVSNTVSQIMDRYKLNKGIGYQYAEDLANVISRRPAEDVNSLFAYLDGDKKALDKLPDAMKLKAVADKLKEWFAMYVAELTPVEQKYFNSRKFSESLLFPERTEQVAGSTFGLGKINEVLGLKREGMTELDQDWFQKDDNGDLVLDGDVYQVFEPNKATPAGGLISAGFISAARFAELNNTNPMGFTVDTTRKWLFEGMKGNQYSFVTNTTAKEKIADQKANDVANALRNTIAALANNYASKHFIKSVYEMGRGDSAHAQVAFDSLEELNKAFGTNVLESQVLPISREISRSPQTKALYRQSGTWVKIPEGSPVYGELSGKYLPGPVWNAMGDMSDRQPVVNWRAANNTMRWFKKSKTVWNFGTHVTNTASNVTMAMLHDISFSTMADASKILAKYEVSPKSLTPSELALMMAFRDSGAMLADYSSAEVKEALYKAHAANLRGGEDVSVMRRVAGWLNIEQSKAEWIKNQVAKGGKFADKADEVTSQMYAAEDNIFRLAAFLKTAGALQDRAGLKTPTQEMLQEAGLFARKAFGDYDIDSKAVKIGRQTVMPFISWFYAMAPVIGRIAVYEPWKLTNVLMSYMLLEAAMGAAAGDDEEKRKEGPNNLRERLFGAVGPYTHIRIPFMGDDKNPVYYNLGDYFPTSSFTRGLPNGLAGQSWIPASLTPSGPFVSGILGLVGGVDPYTGKSLHQPTDTEWQKLWTSAKFAYDTATVPTINSKTISKVNDMIDEKTGITGTEPSSLFLARAFGLKFYDYNEGEQAAVNQIVRKRIEHDFKSAMTKTKRDEYRKGYPDYEALDTKLNDLQTRMQKELEKARGEE
jgi:hypothetical protein